MISFATDKPARLSKALAWSVLLAAFMLTLAVYWPGLSGGYLFDDYPNIVDNRGVQPVDASFPSLVRAALSSPSSEFKRPLASLSFAANYLATGLDPFWMKLTNLLIHLSNGLVAFVLARTLLGITRPQGDVATDGNRTNERNGWVAALIAAAWLLLPINLTGVLYVVQRMESLANLFVLLGLLGYVAGRRRMLAGKRGLLLCSASLVVPAAIGLLAKETAVMLPLYACLAEWTLFRFAGVGKAIDKRLWLLFGVVLFAPMVLGLAWVLPGVLSPGAFATRDFTLGERLLTEPRIILDYIAWTLLPTPHALSFYHDDYRVSHSLLDPWTTLPSILLLVSLVAGAIALRRRAPLAALGLAWFLGAQLLTGTILPLELIYEHRNYFASLGLLLTLIPFLAAPPTTTTVATANKPGALPLALPRYTLLAGLLILWAGLTAATSQAWGSPLSLAEDLAARAPQSPRAQYELGRTYIIYSHYDPQSPFTKLAYAPLERAAVLPNSSILPEQALLFMNARMHLPLKEAWWDSLIAKLAVRRSGVQDESSLEALTQCAEKQECDLPKDRMVAAFTAALRYPNPSARLLAIYGDYAWNVLGDHSLGERVTEEATKAAPNEPAYQISLIRMLAVQGHRKEAYQALLKLQALNVGGRLNGELDALHVWLDPPLHSASANQSNQHQSTSLSGLSMEIK